MAKGKCTADDRPIAGKITLTVYADGSLDIKREGLLEDPDAVKAILGPAGTPSNVIPFRPRGA